MYTRYQSTVSEFIRGVRVLPTPSCVPNSPVRVTSGNWHQFRIQVLHHARVLRLPLLINRYASFMRLSLTALEDPEVRHVCIYVTKSKVSMNYNIAEYFRQ